MNRRSMLSTVIGACATVLVPWRKATGTDDGEAIPIKEAKCIGESRPKGHWDRKIRQIDRIQKLLDRAPVRWHLHNCLGLAPGVPYECHVTYVAESDNISVCVFNNSEAHRLVAAVAFRMQTAETLPDGELIHMIGKALQRSASQYQRDKRLSVIEWIAENTYKRFPHAIGFSRQI